MLVKKFRFRKLNENFSSIDPQGKESKAHKLWKWLMNNGSKTRVEIYSFDKSYSTVLAKYIRNGLVRQDGELYSAVPDYKFEDIKPLDRSTNELEDKFQNYKNIKLNEVNDSITKYNEWYEKNKTYNEKIDKVKVDLKKIKDKINGSVRIANKIDKEGSIKIYNMRGVRNAVHPSKYISERLKNSVGTFDYCIDSPWNMMSNLRTELSDFKTHYPSTVKDLKDKLSDSLNFYKTNDSAADPERHIESIELVISSYNKLLNNYETISNMIQNVIPKAEEATNLDPGLKPENPMFVTRIIPRELSEDYTELMHDSVYRDKLYDFIDLELSDKVRRECPNCDDR